MGNLFNKILLIIMCLPFGDDEGRDLMGNLVPPN